VHNDYVYKTINLFPCIDVFPLCDIQAHNIDNVCLESLSVAMDNRVLENASNALTELEAAVSKARSAQQERLTQEYSDLVAGLRVWTSEQGLASLMPATSAVADSVYPVAPPVYSEDLLTEAMPGNIRKGEHFLVFLRRFVEYMKMRLRFQMTVKELPNEFLQHLYDTVSIEPKPLQFASERLALLMRTLEISDIGTYESVILLCSFATLVGKLSLCWVLLTCFLVFYDVFLGLFGPCCWVFWLIMSRNI